MEGSPCESTDLTATTARRKVRRKDLPIRVIISRQFVTGKFNTKAYMGQRITPHWQIMQCIYPESFAELLGAYENLNVRNYFHGKYI
jgi:hypothetical protein